MRSIVARLALAFALVLSVSALTGCSQSADPAPDQSIGDQNLATETADDGAITDDHGNQFSTGNEMDLPADWPSEVPGFDGRLGTVSNSPDQKSRMAIWEADGDPEKIYADYKAVLQEAGFTSISFESSAAGTHTLNAEGNGYSVNLMVSGNEASSSITLTIRQLDN